ncbi:hypothetical protein WAF17_07235 [Bernardetia sp. ABR2-2B]|uniref:hypothetical protein n=1 Tax=Bernardetia sp. ABR2-2B TaxID=3127472 RepID=UPI0030CEB002
MKSTFYRNYQNHKNLYFLLSILLISLLSSFLRGYALFQTDFANGWDGYFYLVQMQSLFETGKAHTGDASIIYHFLTFFYFIFQDYVISYKIGISLLVGIFTFLLIVLTKKYSTKKIALLIGVLILCSPHLTYFVSQYPKNMLGVVSLILFWLVFPKEFSSKRSNLIYQVTILILILILNYFSHKLTFFIALLWICIYFFAKVNQLKLIFVGICGLILISFLKVDLTEYWSQWRRIHDALGGFSFVPYHFWESFGNERISIFWRTEIIISFFVVLFSLVILLFDKNKITLFHKVTVITLSLLLLPVFKWDLEGVSFRFFMLFGVLWLLIIPILVEQASCLFNKLNYTTIFLHRLEVCATLFLIIFSFFSSQSYTPTLHDPTNQTYKVITDNFEKQSNRLESKVKLLILHKSFAEYFTFRTKIDALPWLPEPALKEEISDENLYRLATHIRKEEFEYYLKDNLGNDLKNENKVKRLGLNYFLLKEIDYRKMIVSAKNENDTLLIERMTNHNYNPSRIRPLFLLEQKEK